MNKYITLLLLGVLAAAMLLVLFVHMSGSPEDPVIPVGAEPQIEELAPVVENVDPVPAEPAASPEPETPAAQPETPAQPAPEPAADPAPASPPPAAATPAQPAPAPRATPGPGAASVSEGSGKILDLSLHFKDQGMILRIEGDGPLPAKYFILSDPERLVVDLPGSWKELKTPNIPSNNLVKSVRIGRQGNADRLVLDLLTPLKKHEINRISDRKVELYFQQ